MTERATSQPEINLVDRSNAIKQMRALLKTDQPDPTDEEVAAMLEKRRLKIYSSSTDNTD